MLANNSTAVPAQRNFQGFGFFPAISGQTVAFTGTDANFHSGVYASSGGAVSVLQTRIQPYPTARATSPLLAPLSLSQAPLPSRDSVPTAGRPYTNLAAA